MATIKSRIPTWFPTDVTVQSPLILVKTGGNYDFSINTASIIGSGVTVFQLRVALGSSGQFFAVDNFIADAPGTLISEAWAGGGIKTNTGDSLYNTVVQAIGAPATTAAYLAASAVIL